MARVNLQMVVDEQVRDEWEELVDHCIDFNTRTSFVPPTNRRLLSEAQRIGRFNPHQIYILDVDEQRIIEDLRRQREVRLVPANVEAVREEVAA